MTGAFGLVWEEAEPGPGGWQGIRALSLAGPTETDPEARLTLSLFEPAHGLAPADLRIAGPEGAPGPAFTAEVTEGSDEITLRLPLPPGGGLPRGRHLLRLLSGGDAPLHPFFAEASFDLYIDCPAGDCRPRTDPLPAPLGREPSIDLATKDYAGFLAAVQDRVRSTAPEGADLAPASTEAVLIELLAHHAEMLSLHQDRVAQEAFLDTARERVSLARHARLLGLRLDEGATAETLLALDIGATEPGHLPAGTPVERREPGGRVTMRFETAETVLLDPLWNAGLADPALGRGLRPAAWPGAAEALLPPGATGLLLLGWDLGLGPGMRVALLQGQTVHVARLAAVRESEQPGWTADPADPPTTAPARVTEIAWDPPTPAAFRPWSDPSELPFLVTANLVRARHGETRRASSRPGPGEVGFSAGRRDAVLATDPATGRVLLRALRTPEGGVLTDAGPPPRPALAFAHDGAEFLWQPDLRLSSGHDRHFTTERDEDGSVWLIFGDGVQGAALPSGPGLPPGIVTLAYRQGDPAAGNIGAFALNAIGPPADATRAAEVAALAIAAVTNILPATGGRPPVPLDTARQLIPESIRHPPLERCVTPADYARAAETVPGVARASARPLGGLFNTIAVLVAPTAPGPLSPALAARVHARLDALRMAGREHVVHPPDLLALDIELLVCPSSHAGAETIRRDIRRALLPGPDAAPGFFHPARLGFGSEIRLAELLAAVQAQPSVGAAKALTFRPLGDAGPEPVRRAIRLGPSQIAVMEGDEARPDRGRLAIRVEGEGDHPGAFEVAGPAPEEAPP